MPLEFSLIELTGRHWRNAKMQRLLFHGYLLLPLLLFGAVVLGHLALGRPVYGLLAASAFTAILGVTLGVTVSAAVGIVVLAIVGTTSALLWPDEQVLMFDMIFSIRYAFLYGMSSAVILIVITNCTHTHHAAQGSLRRQIGGVVLGLVVSIVIMAMATALVLNIINARQTAILPGNSVAIMLALLPTLLLGLSAYLQSRSLSKAILFALGTAASFALSFGRIGSEYGLEFGGNELLIGMNAVGISMFFVLTLLPFALTRRFVGAWPAAVAASFGGLAIYVAYESIFTLFAFWENLLLASGLLLGGLTFGWIWSGAAYLFEAGWNTLLYQLDSQLDNQKDGQRTSPVRWLRYHSAFWDEIQRFPFFELCDYLVLAAPQEDIRGKGCGNGCGEGRGNGCGEGRGNGCRNVRGGAPQGGTSQPLQNALPQNALPQNALPQNALPAPFPSSDTPFLAMISAINESYQQWAAQAAYVELDARRLEQLESVEALASTRTDAAAGLLATPAGLMLRNFAQLGGDVAAALAQPSPYNQRLVMSSVARDIENLQGELARNPHDPLAVRYTTVASQWHTVVVTHIAALDSATQANREIPNPYVVGVPLTRRQEIFVGRTDVARYVEDILRMGDHPPVLLYGPRRMGKTSLLYQLHWMLPHRILPLVVDLQGPVSLASSNPGFLHALARGIRMAALRSDLTLPDLPRAQLKEEPFTVFDDWLDQVSEVLTAKGHEVMLLALDEFEALDAALSAGTLEEHAILGMLRHVVQHRRGVKLLLSGSHTLDEFRRWSSYLINAQVVELGYLEEAETRHLIQEPIADFPLRYTDNAIAYVLHLTRGHPYLVQLLCMEIVALKNRHPHEQRIVATVTDVEAAVPAMLERGQQFFADIELNQVDSNGRAILGWIAEHGPGFCVTVSELMSIAPHEPLKQVEDVEATLQRMVQRRLLEEGMDGFCFQVEAIRRWFAKI